MGGKLAVRFLGAGYTVYGETRHRDAVQAMESEGLVWRDTPRELAEAADVVFTSVPNDISCANAPTSTPQDYHAGAMPSHWLAVGPETDPLQQARQLQRSWERLLAGGALGLELPPGATAGLRPAIVESWRRALAT